MQKTEADTSQGSVEQLIAATKLLQRSLDKIHHAQVNPKPNPKP